MTVGDQRGIDIVCFDEGEDLSTVAAVSSPVLKVRSLLYISGRGRAFLQTMIRIGHTDESRLSAVNAATQGPAAVGVGAVVHIAVLSEEVLAAEGLHIHRHPVTGPHGSYSGTNFLHHTHHLMAHGDAGNRPRHRAMLM